jgi:hypothetical protein
MRHVLQGVAAAATVRPAPAWQAPKKVAVFSPGLFGSTPRNQTGTGTTNIWTRDICQLHDALLKRYNRMLFRATRIDVLEEGVLAFLGGASLVQEVLSVSASRS